MFTKPRYRGCINCGCICQTIGFVPPKTLECRTCGEVFRLTDENKIKMKAAVDREEVSQSLKRYPTRLTPSLKKLRGER